MAFELLKKQKSGTFIDIGANDGLSLSNSLLFEKNGWTGVCVEPNPVIFEDLSNSRNCECLNACISDSDGIVSFLAIDGPANMLSGIQDFLDESSLERIDREIKEKGGSKSIMEVESITPKSLLERFNLQSVDFLSVDTEGAEFGILELFGKSQVRPQVISVENGGRSSDLFTLLVSQGYKLHKCIGCDEIYQFPI